MVSSILRGQKYTGRAFVVKEWLMTTYAPIYDNRKRIAGMLFVGLKDNMAAMVEKAITSIDVGTTGYVYVLDSKGYYVISQKSKRNGEWIWESKDSDGKYFVQDIIKIALSLNKGEIGNLRYPWKNQEDPVARYKHAKIMYFAPWDWVIGAGSYEEEFLAAVNKITVISNTGNTIFFVLFLVTLFITVFVWWLVSKIITNPIVHVITELSESADQVSSASSQMSKSAQEISEGASEQASTLEEVSSSMEELSAMTKQNADNAASSEKLSKVSKKNAEQGNESMKSLGEAMYMVDASAQEMGKIIKNIEEIAFQTNMLALNAAVEAARAGEHGRGFAVVAEEVRNLARKAGDFAKSTAALVVETMDQIKNGTEVSKKTMQMFDEIVKDANQVNELASEVSAATQEQARGLNQVTISITDMDKVVQSNAANAEESSSIGEELNAQAVGLQSMVERLMEIIGMSHNHNSSEKNERFQKTVNPRGMGNRATARPTFQKSLPNKKSLQQAKLPVKPEDVIPLEKDEFKDF